MFSLILICALFAVHSSSVECASRFTARSRVRYTSRIVGGDYVPIESFKWQAALLKEDKEKNLRLFCGGTIVAPTKILTAAHCTKDIYFYWQISVRVGSTEHDKGGFSSGITKIINHPKFNDPSSMNNDISVIILKESLVFGPTIGGILLGSEAMTLPVGALVTVSGYGSTSKETEEATKLQAVSVPIVSYEVCKKAYKKYTGQGKLTEEMICAGFLGSGKKDACKGDSGGPLVYTTPNAGPVLYGVISWGADCADPNFPGIYTKVALYRDWINNAN